MTNDLSQKLQLVAETLEWYAAHEAIYPVLNNCVSAKAKEAQAVLAGVIEGLEASQHQPVAVEPGVESEGEWAIPLSSMSGLSQDTFSKMMRVIRYGGQVDFVARCDGREYRWQCDGLKYARLRPIIQGAGMDEEVSDENIKAHEARVKHILKDASKQSVKLKQPTRHESTSAEVASKAGRVMAEADGLIELLEDTYPGIDHDDFQMIHDFFGDAKSVAASALTQREPAGNGGNHD